VVLNRLDHHPVLQLSVHYLHTTRVANCRVRHIAIARNLVRRVNDDHTLAKVIGKHTGHFPEHGRFANTRSAQQQDALARLDQVLDQAHAAKHGAAHAARQADGFAGTVSDY
jgi:hypothetical protein